MTHPHLTVHFDFVDPLSLLVAEVLRRVDDVDLDAVRWQPFEIRPPPMPLTTVDDPELEERWRTARTEAAALGIAFRPPLLVPWTRKAHELVLHARASRLDRQLRDRLFAAHLLEGADIGRVDVLVDIAHSVGLDRTEAKAVLDVDRYEAEIAELRAAALAGGVRAVPTVTRGEKRLEGFHNAAALRTFLDT